MDSKSCSESGTRGDEYSTIRYRCFIQYAFDFISLFSLPTYLFILLMYVLFAIFFNARIAAYQCFLSDNNIPLSQDWTRKGGWRVMHSIENVTPGDPRYPMVSDRKVGADYASRNFKNSSI